jgi:hypothetical protein
MKSSVVFGLVLLPALASADQVFLKGGREVSGVIVERSASHITLEVGPGRVSLPMDRVERVQEGSSPLREYRRRRAALAPDDVRGFVALGIWCRDQELFTQAREAFEHAVALDPGNATAQVALGNVRLGNRFVTQDEANRAQGLVRYQGTWMTPDERNALVEENQEDARARAEAAARREARERAEREAEAAAAQQAAAPYGMPYSPYGYGGYGLGVGFPYAPYVPRRPRIVTSVVVAPPRVVVVPRVSAPPPPPSAGSTNARAPRRTF